MSGRLVVVSNRIPTGATPSGGLVVALHDALTQRGGLWIGAHPDPADDAEPGLFEVGNGAYTRMAFRLSEREHRDYYLGFSNSVLWPICHRRGDLVELDRHYEESYLALNRRLARMIFEVIAEDDLLWIHDYHLLPLALELRRLGVANRIGFFLHIPFPALGDLAVLPTPDDFAAWLAAYNLVGLQTRSDTARCLEMFRADPRAEFLPDGTVKFRDSVVSVRSYPIGIDVDSFRADALSVEDNPFGTETPREYIIGVDRLDYSKGIPNRFRAFGQYLERHAGARRPCLVQIAPPSRNEVEAYRQITSELEEIAGRLNGAYAELDWTPIRYIHRSVDRTRLARLFRGARGCLVTSFADGMNLVAKEFVAAQDPEDPGVLILSRLAGVAEDLKDAVLVNPYDVEDIADAIDRALNMPLAERRRRHAACLRAVEATDIARWSESFLDTLETCAPTLGVSLRGLGLNLPWPDAGTDDEDGPFSAMTQLGVLP